MRTAIHRDVLASVRAHFDTVLASGRDTYGGQSNTMWMANLDPATGAAPQTARTVRPRTYRTMHADGGSNLYFHQPDLVAAKALSVATGDARYGAAADAYVDDFLGRCVAANGRFCWGNHYYWDAGGDSVIFLNGDAAFWPAPMTETLVDLATDAVPYHEIRPFGAAWDILHARAGSVTEGHVAATSFAAHCINTTTGEFNRHSANQGGSSLALLEALGAHVNALVWLYGKTADAALLARADLMVGYALGEAGAGGLIRNCRNSAANRWDRDTATTELAVVAKALMDARGRVPAARRADWIGKARQIVDPWLLRAWDATARRYVGKLQVSTGLPYAGTLPGTQATEFRPGDYSDPWVTGFPFHDYPHQMADVCIDLFQETGAALYLEAVHRHAAHFLQGLPGSGQVRSTAEHYGRLIRFFLRCADELGLEGARGQAWRIAEDAVRTHFTGTLFRTNRASGWYEAVDGGGWLMMSLLRLAGGEEIELHGLRW